MVIGAIDIGTNSTRLLLAEKNKQGLTELASELRTPRLGEGVHKNEFLQEDAMNRTIKTLKEYQEIIDSYNGHTIAVATSAVRDAVNKASFLERVKKEVGIDIEVIEGIDEARLSYYGITSSLEKLSKRLLAIDIGGGSTELIFGKPNKMSEFTSINLGAVRLSENYGEDLESMKKEAYRMLSGVITDKEVEQLIGVGGTVTTLVAIKESLEEYDSELVHGFKLLKRDIEKILDRLQKLSLKERKKVIGLNPKRADIILGGIIILLTVMELVDQPYLKVSDASILEGLVYDFSR
ncbi:Ppx/GppA phosphatase family protein [Orenia marismortui]|uniref:Ppx/GppA phosphatase n=1 Tax=Orenia marismortui TaxID=46469 RepID=A0A4R8GFM1_9FIRM|nr:Ppx/GppA phosphatase family protein [Orenia marismortui]TDX44396.1 Ppx/GppA phosphatase [Orenia marismortui]